MIDRRYRGKQHISRKIPYDLPQIAACAAHYAEASVNRAAGCPNMVGFAEASEKHAVLDCRANGATAELFLQVEALRAGVLEAHLECGGGRGLLRGHVAVCALGKILAAGVIVGLHFAVVFANAVQNPVRLGVVRIVEELDIARQSRLRVGVLVWLAEREAEHRVCVLRQCEQLDQFGNIAENRAENHSAEIERFRRRLHGMQCEHGVVLRLRETVAVLERELVGICRHALGLRDQRVAVLIEHEYVEHGRVRNVILIADARDLRFHRRILDANHRPVVEILAGCGVLCGLLDGVEHIRLDGLVFEGANGDALEQHVHGVIVNNLCHSSHYSWCRAHAQQLSRLAQRRSCRCACAAYGDALFALALQSAHNRLGELVGIGGHDCAERGGGGGEQHAHKQALLAVCLVVFRAGVHFVRH